MARNNETIARNYDVVRQDFGICEVSQGNLEAGPFDRGPLSPRHDDGVRHFHELVRQSLGGA